MKLKAKQQARVLRRRGISINKIADKLNVSKSSVSIWVSDIKLNPQLLSELKDNSHSRVAIEKRRNSRIKRAEVERGIIQFSAQQDIKKVTSKDLFLIGIALYWGEGSKKKRSMLEFTNSDPDMIQVMMKFYKLHAKIPIEKFRGHVYIHDHLNIRKAEKYWSDVSGIPLKQFYKTTIQRNRTINPKDSLPNGTFAIVVCDTRKKLQMNGWMQGLFRKSMEA